MESFEFSTFAYFSICLFLFVLLVGQILTLVVAVRDFLRRSRFGLGKFHD